MILKNVLLSFLGFLFFLPFIFTTPTLAFNPLDSSCESIPAGQSPICDERNQDENPLTGTSGIIFAVANVLAVAGSIIAVIIIVIAGITMALSGGDPAKVKTSRDAIIYTVVGLIIIVLARSIVVFIINRVGVE